VYWKQGCHCKFARKDKKSHESVNVVNHLCLVNKTVTNQDAQLKTINRRNVELQHEKQLQLQRQKELFHTIAKQDAELKQQQNLQLQEQKQLRARMTKQAAELARITKQFGELQHQKRFQVQKRKLLLKRISNQDAELCKQKSIHLQQQKELCARMTKQGAELKQQKALQLQHQKELSAELARITKQVGELRQQKNLFDSLTQLQQQKSLFDTQLQDQKKLFDAQVQQQKESFDLQIGMLAQHPNIMMQERYRETKQEVAKALSLSKWNGNGLSASVRIDKNTMSCCCSGEWQSATLAEVFWTGVHEAKFRMDSCRLIMIGVVNEEWDGYKHKHHVGQDKMSWSLSSTGARFHNGKHSAFTSALQTDQTVTITVNMNNGTMSAAISGIPFGVCHRNLHGRLRFAVSLYYRTCRVTCLR